MGRMSSKPRFRWFQFRLRSLLIALTLLAIVPGGYIVHERGEAQRMKAAVAMLGAELQHIEVYAHPNWLHSLLVPGIRATSSASASTTRGPSTFRSSRRSPSCTHLFGSTWSASPSPMTPSCTFPA